jgi:DNA-binding CsgD family transcriptional regulator
MRQMSEAENVSLLRPLPTPPPTNVVEAPAGRRTWALAWPAGLFLLLTFFVGADMAADIAAGTSMVHLAIETVAFLIALGGVAGTFVQLWSALRHANQLERHANELQRDLDGTRADLTRWRTEAQEALRGLGAAIDRQFARWDLTPAECEVALLILKGLSHREIADARATSERTVRQQALAIYRKAGLTGRAELAAFFLEDLLLPQADRPSP